MNRSAISAALVAGSLLATQSVSGAIVPDGFHVQVDSFLVAGSGSGAVVDGPRMQAPSAVDTGELSHSRSAWSASGRAKAGASGHQLRTKAFSSSPSVSSGATSLMQAAWRDVLLVTGSGAPTELKFNFRVDGTLTVSHTSPSPSRANESRSSSNSWTRSPLTACRPGSGDRRRSTPPRASRSGWCARSSCA